MGAIINNTLNTIGEILSEKRRMSSMLFVISFFLGVLCDPSPGLAAGTEEGDKEHILYSVTVPGAPIIIKNKRIMYGLDLIFDTVPTDFWVYYSDTKKKLVVDFYGIYVTGEPKVELTGRGVFQDVMIDNYTTNLALTKKRSTILIGVVPDPGWHFKAVAINRRTIRITAWKDITGLTKIERNKNIVGRYLLITVLVSLLTFVGVYGINKL